MLLPASHVPCLLCILTHDHAHLLCLAQTAPLHWPSVPFWGGLESIHLAYLSYILCSFILCTFFSNILIDIFCAILFCLSVHYFVISLLSLLLFCLVWTNKFPFAIGPVVLSSAVCTFISLSWPFCHIFRRRYPHVCLCCSFHECPMLTSCTSL